MKVIDAEALQNKYPERKSLNNVLNQARPVSIVNQIESIKEDMCTNYCRMPYKYSKGEWEDMVENNREYWPCLTCPLNRL